MTGDKDNSLAENFEVNSFGKHVEEEINVDHLLDNEVEPCGLWQNLTVTLILLSIPSTATFPVFANSVPMKRCKMEDITEHTIARYNFTFEQAAAVIGPWYSNFSSKSIGLRGCTRYANSWNNESLSMWIDTLVNSNFSEVYSYNLTSCTDGFVYHLNELQYPSSVVVEFETVCDKNWLVPLGTSGYMLGLMFGFVLGGWAGDRWGRKRAGIGLSFLEIISTIGASLAPNYIVYVACRSIIGMMNIGKLTVYNILMMEITLAKYRACYGSLIALMYNFVLRGFLSLTAYYIHNWRLLHVVAMSYSLFCITHCFLLVESPRWLLSQKRRVEALQALQWGYKLNHKYKSSQMLDRWISKEKSYSNQTHLQETDTAATTSLVSCYERMKNGILAPFSTPDLIKVTVLGILIFNFHATTFFGILLYAGAIRASVYLVHFFNACTTVPGIILATILYGCIRSRRKPLCATYLIASLMLFAGGLYTIIAQPKNDIILTIASNVGMTFVAASMSMVYIYLPELYPSSMRSLGFGLQAGIGRLGSIFCTFINEMDTFVAHGSPLLVYGSVTIFTVAILFLLPDTNGENLVDSQPSTNKAREDGLIHSLTQI